MGSLRLPISLNNHSHISYTLCGATLILYPFPRKIPHKYSYDESASYTIASYNLLYGRLLYFSRIQKILGSPSIVSGSIARVFLDMLHFNVTPFWQAGNKIKRKQSGATSLPQKMGYVPRVESELSLRARNFLIGMQTQPTVAKLRYTINICMRNCRIRTTVA